MNGTGGDRETRWTLPRGWRDRDGKVHREVAMRPSRARDEIRALADFRVYLRPESFVSVLLSRVITRLGPLGRVTPGVVDELHPADVAALEDAYRRTNGYAPRPEEVAGETGGSVEAG